MTYVAFLLAAFIALNQSALLPAIPLFPFAPFIALVCIRTPLKNALWLAMVAGFCNDLLSSDLPGIHAASATFVCAIIHRCQFRALKDLSLQLCFYSALIAAFTVIFELLILFLFDQRIPLAGKSILLDFIEIPLIHAAYAFLWFVGPLLLWEWGAKQWKKWRLQTNETS